MKNILTIAVVTPSFYYFGWYVYGCFEEGWPKSGHASPDVLKRMNDNLDWTQDLGEAFLADQAAVMDTVQTMRRKALESGNLKTTKEKNRRSKDAATRSSSSSRRPPRSSAF